MEIVVIVDSTVSSFKRWSEPVDFLLFSPFLKRLFYSTEWPHKSKNERT